MYQVQNITDDARQKHNLALPDGTVIQLAFHYAPMQLGWFMDSIIFASQPFTLNGLRICNTPNLLHQYRNQIPFGLGITTIGGREPTQQQDFSSQASRIFILTPEEVETFTDYLSE